MTADAAPPTPGGSVGPRRFGHLPVLPREVLAALAPSAGQVYVDATAGRGGHACLVAPALGPTGTVVLFDLDPGNLAAAAAAVRALPDAPRVETIHGSFAEAPHRLRALGLTADMLLADLGFASNQVDDPARGLSFREDGPLDMRLNPEGRITAAHLVASTAEAELARIFRDFAEERYARRIAAEIVRRRQIAPITTTRQLAELVRAVVPPDIGPHGPRIDQATRTFQALRIAVNDELGHLHALLSAVTMEARRAGAAGSSGPARWLAPGARVAIIAFHSLEDRPVKQAFADLVKAGGGGATVIGDSPTTAQPDEVAGNPRSRSAKLRCVRLRGLRLGGEGAER